MGRTRLSALGRRHPGPSFLQPSWRVQAFLFNLCQEVNRVGGHALPKVTLQEMLKDCLAQVLAAYEKLAADRQTKVGARWGPRQARRTPWLPPGSGPPPSRPPRAPCEAGVALL